MKYSPILHLTRHFSFRLVEKRLFLKRHSLKEISLLILNLFHWRRDTVQENGKRTPGDLQPLFEFFSLLGWIYVCVCAYNHVPCHSLGYDLWVPAPILFGHKVFLIYPQKKRHARTSCNLPLYMKRHWSSLFQKSIKRPQLRTTSCGCVAEFLFACTYFNQSANPRYR